MKNFKMEHYTQDHVNKILNQSMEEYHTSFKVQKGFYKVFDQNIDNRIIYPYTFEGAGDCMVDFIKALKSMGLNYSASRFLIDECEDYDDKPFFKQHRACFGVYPRIKMCYFPFHYVYEHKNDVGTFTRVGSLSLRPGILFRDRCDRLYTNTVKRCKREMEMGYSGDIERSMSVIIEEIRRFFKYVLDVKEYLDKESTHFESIIEKYDLSKERINYALEVVRWCGYFTPPELSLGFRQDVLESYFKANDLKFEIPDEQEERLTEAKMTKLIELSLIMKEKLKRTYYSNWNYFRKEMETNWAKTPYRQELLATNRAGMEFPADPKFDEDIPVLNVIANAAVEIWRNWSLYFPRTTGHCLLKFKKGLHSDGTTAKGPIWKGLLMGQYYAFMHLCTLEQLKYESKFFQSTEFFEYLANGFVGQLDFIIEKKIDQLKVIYRMDIPTLNAIYDASELSIDRRPDSISDIITYYEKDYEDALHFLGPDYFKEII